MVERYAEDSDLTPAYGSRTMDHSIPKYRLPDDEMPAQTAYRMIHDELMLDGNARLNLATFVTTWMEPEAEKLMAETFEKNMIDKDEYPQTAEIETRCVNMLVRLFNANPDENPMGSSTIGSSEAVMLAGMALKWNWRKRRQQKGASATKPNLVMGRSVQVVWEKFCRYWEVEPRYIPMRSDRFTIEPEEVLARVDENTIGVVTVLGTTFTGAFDPIAEIHDALVDHNKKTGLQVPIHVDAASGGFVAPFLQPDLVWDFRLPNVVSINTSGHKYGLVYPGVGWALWRGQSHLPEELIFHVNYLGGDMPTFTLNFSRPGNQIIGQYYNLLRLGRAGYTRIMCNLRDTALWLSGSIARMGPFMLLSDGSSIPVFAMRLKDSSRFTVFDVSRKLRLRGWQVPAYTLPQDATELAVLRLVIREGFSRDMADLLLKDLKQAVTDLEQAPPAQKSQDDGHFHHN
jgi:glutamate decarboxylase